MERKELYQAVKDRNVYTLFRNLEVELSIVRLDGANTHGIRWLEAALCSMVNLYKEADYPQEETMAEFRQRDREMFDIALDKVEQAVNKYHVKI